MELESGGGGGGGMAAAAARLDQSPCGGGGDRRRWRRIPPRPRPTEVPLQLCRGDVPHVGSGAPQPGPVLDGVEQGDGAARAVWIMDIDVPWDASSGIPWDASSGMQPD